MERKEIQQGIHAGPQLEERELRQLKQEGFQSILDLRREGQTNILIPPKEEAQAAKEAGLDYANIPLDWEHVDHHQFNEFRCTLGQADHGVYVHSRRGDIAAAALILDRAAKKDWDPKIAIDRAEAAGHIDRGSPAADFMHRYLEQRRAEGRRD